VRRARLLLAAAVLGLAGCGDTRTVDRDAPVVLVTIDTLRADHLAAWGDTAVATPAIDRLIGDGIRFANAYAQVPLTLPSHSTLMTGLLPTRHGVRSNIGYRLDGAAHPTLASILAGRGYATGAAVSAYVLRAETGISAGFQRFDDSMEVRQDEPLGALQRPGGQALDAGLRWLDGVGERPFLLWLHLFEPHSPYDPPEPFRSRAPSPYDGEIEAADAIVGRLLAELDRRSLYDRALIVLASDHGEGLGDHGEQEHGILLYRESLHVPLVIKLPGHRRAGEAAREPVGLVDVVPTVLADLGLKVPPDLPGRDLLAGAAADRHLYAETFYPRIHLGWSELRSLLDARYQYIEGPDPELYDLVADPRERENLRDSRRPVLLSRRAELARIPSQLTAAAAATDEERRRLTALGYLAATPAQTGGPRSDPKGRIGELQRLQRDFELVETGRLAEAAADLEALVRDNPEMIDARVQLAAVERRLGRFEQARANYREVVRQEPGYLRTVAIEIGKIELDLDHLEAAAENAAVAMPSSPDEAHLLLAAVAARREDWSRAESEARAAFGDADRPRLPALLLLAQILGQRGRLQQGLELLAAVDRRIASGEARPLPTLESTRGDLLARLGRNQEAETSFRKEIATFPRTEEAYGRLAILLAAEHRFAEIQPTLDAMVAARPTPATCALAARTLDDLGNHAGAEAYRRRARELARGAGAAGR
jgi:choline-sulfatase